MTVEMMIASVASSSVAGRLAPVPRYRVSGQNSYTEIAVQQAAEIDENCW